MPGAILSRVAPALLGNAGLNYQNVTRGADVASASSVVLPLSLSTPTPGDFFHLTGTTTCNHVTIANLVDGYAFEFYFAGAITINHNAGSPPAGTVPFKQIG